MRNKLLIAKCIFIFLIYMTSCKQQDNKIETEHYKNGCVKSVKIYASVNDTLNFKVNHYYLNGQLKGSYIVKQGKYEGAAVTYYESGVLENITKYKNGLVHGVNKVYNESGEKTRESLYLENTQKIYKEFFNNPDGYTKEVFYTVKSGEAEEIGQIVYDKDGDIVTDFTFYCLIELEKDTVNLGDKLKFVITPIIGNCNDECVIELKIGGLNNVLEFIDENDVESFTLQNNDSFLYETSAKHNGDNLLLGKILVKNKIDTNIVETIYLYKDYYVMR